MASEQREIYLDRNATAPVHPEVAAAVAPLLAGHYGNPSSLYAPGLAARKRLAEAREQTARLLGCGADQVVFTSGGTEANNLAIKGAFFGGDEPRHHHLVTTAIEHPAVTEPCTWLKRQGAEVTVVPVDAAGRVDPDAVEAAFRPDTLLVSVMHANNETGVIQPVAEIARRARRRGILVHCDGVQAAGRIPVNVLDLGCDLYSISAHKFGGLKGTGALFVRDRARLDWVQQGGHQEGGTRAGTENVPGIVALGHAAAVAQRDLARNTEAWLATRPVFEDLAKRLPVSRVNGHPTERLPNTTNLCFLYADGMSLMLALSVMGVYIGTGSACATHKMHPSHVLRAMGLSEMAAFCSVRISTGPDLAPADARWAADRIAETVERIRLVTAPEQIGVCDDNCPCFTGGKE